MRACHCRAQKGVNHRTSRTRVYRVDFNPSKQPFIIKNVRLCWAPNEDKGEYSPHATCRGGFKWCHCNASIGSVADGLFDPRCGEVSSPVLDWMRRGNPSSFDLDG